MSIVANSEATITVECSESNCKFFGIGHQEFGSRPGEQSLHTRGAVEGVEVLKMDDAHEWSIDVDIRKDLDLKEAHKVERALSDAIKDTAALNAAMRAAEFDRFADYARSIFAAGGVTEADIVAGAAEGDGDRAARIFHGSSDSAVLVSDVAWLSSVTGKDLLELMMVAHAFLRPDDLKAA